MLLIALACFHFLSSGVQSYASLIDRAIAHFAIDR